MAKNTLSEFIAECVKQEIYLLKEKPEAQPDDIFGQYLFAPSRNDIPDEASHEQNTPPEVQVRKALQNHIGGNDTSQIGKWFNTLYDLVQQGKYTKLLKVPSSFKYAYRLITVDDTTLMSMLPRIKDISQLHNIEKDKVHVQVGGIYNHKSETSNSPVSSWTVEHNAIADMIDGEFSFGMKQMNKSKYNYTVLFVAPVQGNKFLINPSPEYYAAIDTMWFADEQEILGYGPIKLSKILYKLVHVPDQENDAESSPWLKSKHETEEEQQEYQKTLSSFYKDIVPKISKKVR
jgi:hypothetical protein